MANLVFLTGAGISAPSGIRTYRGEGGLWTENPSLEGKMHRNNWNTEGFKDLITEYSEESRSLMVGKEPNAAHKAIAALESSHTVTVITQNVDGLHIAAGSTNVCEMHGNIWRDKTEPDGFVRPDVVFFGENLDSDTWDRAELAVATADYFYLVGTSGVVWPVANLFEIAAYHFFERRTISQLHAFNLDPLDNKEHYMRHFNFTPGDCSKTLPVHLIIAGFLSKDWLNETK